MYTQFYIYIFATKKLPENILYLGALWLYFNLIHLILFLEFHPPVLYTIVTRYKQYVHNVMIVDDFSVWGSSHHLCCGWSESSWWRPVWPCRWSSAHVTPCRRSTWGSCCGVRSDCPSFCSGTSSVNRCCPEEEGCGRNAAAWLVTLTIWIMRNVAVKGDHPMYYVASYKRLLIQDL